MNTDVIVESIPTEVLVERLKEEVSLLKAILREGVSPVIGRTVVVYKCSKCEKEIDTQDRCEKCKKPLRSGFCFTCNPDGRQLAHRDQTRRWRERQAKERNSLMSVEACGKNNLFEQLVREQREMKNRTKKPNAILRVIAQRKANMG